MALIDKILQAMIDNHASDLYLTVGQPVKVRVEGKLNLLTKHSIKADEIENLIKEICPKKKWETFLKNKDINFTYHKENFGRFRASYMFNYFGFAAVFRHISEKIKSFNELKLPVIPMEHICKYYSGLICITGPYGCGKTTTAAAIINYMNENQAKHIVAIEGPIEYLHMSKNSIIEHREIGEDSRSFSDAIESTRKSNPDIMFIGDINDTESIKQALICAAMGILVIVTLNTNSIENTIEEIIDKFEEEEKTYIRNLLAESLKGIVSQQLCKSEDGGMLPVHEILLWVDTLPNIIRNNQLNSIKNIIDNDKQYGMCYMDVNLKGLVQRNIISGKEAYMKAFDKKPFAKYLEEI